MLDSTRLCPKTQRSAYTQLKGSALTLHKVVISTVYNLATSLPKHCATFAAGYAYKVLQMKDLVEISGVSLEDTIYASPEAQVCALARC